MTSYDNDNDTHFETGTDTVNTGTNWTPNRKVIAGAIVAVIAFIAGQFGLDLAPVVPALGVLTAAYLVPEHE